jgi:hypothetical protein
MSVTIEHFIAKPSSKGHCIKGRSSPIHKEADSLEEANVWTQSCFLYPYIKISQETRNVKCADVHKLYCRKPELINEKLRTLNPIARNKIQLVGNPSNTDVHDLAYVITSAVGLQEQLTEN